MAEKNKKGGHYHPLTLVANDIVRIFTNLGFEVAGGPERETEFNNFDALNIPADHPARDLWDTFWLKTDNEKNLLRTHTSPVQVRYMMANKPPIKIISPGKCYRYEASDATHESEFHQVEGLFVDKNIALADLKGTLDKFFDQFFGQNLNVRFRPSYFPFVEPGVEVDVSCFNCNGDSSCRVCKGSSWIEIMGAGMVAPKVLSSVGINPRDYQGFAFGGGIDRLAMIKYGVNDIRLFYSGDLRFINQF